MEYFIASIPVNESRIIKFFLINTNPLDISIDKISLTLPKTNIQLSQMQILNGSETTSSYKATYRKDDIIKVE